MAGLLLGAGLPEQTLVNGLWASRWPRRLVRGRTVLVGDSAHAMSPNLGRGACESLVDAHVLGTALRDRPVEAALRHYERRRLVIPSLIGWASGRVLRVATTRHERLRNGALALAPRRATAPA